MKNTAKKILALLLSAMMIFGCLGVTTLAAGDVVDDDIIIEDDDIIIDDDVIIDDEDIVEDEGDDPETDVVDDDGIFSSVMDLVNTIVPGIYDFISSKIEFDISLEQVMKVAGVIAKLVYAIVMASI